MNREKLTFSIVVSEAPGSGEALEKAAERFADFFHFENDLSRRILLSAPVLFLNDLSRSDVSSVKPLLIELSEKEPLSFRVTSAELPPLPEVVWSEVPDFEEAASGETFSDVRIDYHENDLTCPSCDEELFLNRNARTLPVADSTGHRRLQRRFEQGATSAATDAGAPDTTEEETPEEFGEGAAEEPVADGEEEPVEEVAEERPGSSGPPEQKPDEAEPEPVLDGSDPGEPERSPAVADESEAPEHELEEIALEEEAEAEEQPEPADADADLRSEEDEENELEEFMTELEDELNDLGDLEFEGGGEAEEEDVAPETAEDADTGSGSTSGTDEEEDPEQDTSSENAEQPSPEVSSAAGNFNVFIPGSVDSEREELASLLMDIRDCSSSDAEELLSRPITPVVNGVTEERAHNVRRRFEEIGVNVNITEK